jgi:predicted ATPase with chaperone activity
MIAAVTVTKYAAKLSGPLLDRIDLHVTVARITFAEMVGSDAIESSPAIRMRVEAAPATPRSPQRTCAPCAGWTPNRCSCWKTR